MTHDDIVAKDVQKNPSNQVAKQISKMSKFGPDARRKTQGGGIAYKQMVEALGSSDGRRMGNTYTRCRR